MQMAEELGTYRGRHEYKDRIIGGKNREAYYRLNIDAPAEELHLALKNLSADANVELLRDNGGGIVNSTLIFPVDGSNQSGTEAEYKGYANVQPGNYLVRVYLPNSSTQWAKYDLLMNLDQAGEDSSKTRDLGMLTNIAQLSDYQLSDFVGADKGDSSDVYKFQVGDYGLVHLALKPPAGDGKANMLAANMRLQDESGKDVTFLNANKNSGENYAAAYLQPGKSYYLTVAPTPRMMTNYNLVINPVSEETINGFRVSDTLYKLFAKYRESIGNPTSAVQTHASGAKFQIFQNGSIVSSSYGTFPLYDGIREEYLNNDGLNGLLGAPKNAEYDWNGGKRQDFAGGYITWKNGTTNAYKPDGSLLYPPPPNFPVGGIDLAGLQKLLYGNVSTTITASWGQKNCKLWGSHPDCKHPGIDIAATGTYLEKHSPIYSPVEGVVTAVDTNHGLVYLYNEKTDTTFRFLHMNSWNVSQGNRVSKGQQIGTEGRRGNATGDHLHIDAWQGKHNSGYPDYSDTINPVYAVNLANNYTGNISNPNVGLGNNYGNSQSPSKIVPNSSNNNNTFVNIYPKGFIGPTTAGAVFVDSNYLILAGVRRLYKDVKVYGMQKFPADYYDTIGRYLFDIAAAKNGGDYKNAFEQLMKLSDGEFGWDFQEFYKKIVGNDTVNGWDKVRHFAHSAYLRYSFGVIPVSEVGGRLKELQDQLENKLPFLAHTPVFNIVFEEDLEGWSEQDMIANYRGIAFAKEKENIFISPFSGMTDEQFLNGLRSYFGYLPVNLH
jgi:murein DD-endopeptidase MepM/ murein hydrolase activator NlpD